MKRKRLRKPGSAITRRKAAPRVQSTGADLSQLRVLAGSRSTGKRVRAIIDPVTGMNRTETAYSQVLEIKRLAGEILEWRFEPIKLKLADKTFYTPDFAVLQNDQSLELIDIKGRCGDGPGGWEEDAKVKIKVAAKLYPWFLFVGICRCKEGWKRTEF